MSIILKVNLDNIVYNYNKLKKKSKTIVASVVKANAYGLGVKEVSNKLILAGCKNFFVATLIEAIELRKIHKGIHIYVLNGIYKNEINQFLKNNVSPVINNINEFNIINKINKKIDILLHYDTGMNRLGLSFDELKKINKNINYSKINIKYIISHLASSEQKKDNFNKKQLQKFVNIKSVFINTKLSLSNSAGIFLNSKFNLDMVRPGISLYGGYGNKKIKKEIKNVIKLKAKIIQKKYINKNETIGYNQTYKVKNNMYIATVAAGYADGISRLLSNKGHVYFKNKKLSILGRISMDTFVIDINKINRIIKIGDFVEIINDKYDIEMLAKDTLTVSQDILTSFGTRVRKTYN